MTTAVTVDLVSESVSVDLVSESLTLELVSSSVVLDSSAEVGPPGPAGVVAATAPVTYDGGTQTVALNVGDGLDVNVSDELVVDATVVRNNANAVWDVGAGELRQVVARVDPAASGAFMGITDSTGSDSFAMLFTFGTGPGFLASGDATGSSLWGYTDDGAGGHRWQGSPILSPLDRIAVGTPTLSDDAVPLGYLTSALGTIDGGAP